MEHPCRPQYCWIAPFVTEYSKEKTALWIFEGANPITKKHDHRMDFLTCAGGWEHGYNRPLLCPQNMTNKVWLAKVNLWEGASESLYNNEDHPWSKKPGKY